MYLLKILFVNLVYQFSEVHVLFNLSACNLILLQTNNSYFTKIALVGFQYEQVSLDVNEVCFDEE